MFNLQGSEVIFILLLALVVLGPEKLPGAIRRVTKTYVELRKLGDGFQSEFRSAIDEPLRELRETAELVKGQSDPKRIAEQAEREAEAAAAAEKKASLVESEAALAPPISEPDAVGDDPTVDPFDGPIVDPFDDPMEASQPGDEPVEEAS